MIPRSILIPALLIASSLCAQLQFDTIPPDYYGEDYRKTIAYREDKGQTIGTDGDHHNEIAFYSEGLWPQVHLKKDSKFSFQFTVQDTIINVPDTIYKFDVACVGEGAHHRTPTGIAMRGDYQNFYLPWTMPLGAEHVRAFNRTTYTDVWHKVDMQFYSGSGGQKIAFVVRPGGNPDDILLQISGQDSMKLDVNGALDLFLKGKWVKMEQAVAYQYDANNNIVPVNWTASYDVVNGSDLVSFHFDTYDTTKPLVLLIGKTPPGWQAPQSAGLCWGSYLGGNSQEQVYGNASDAAGNYYVCGNTWSDFITYGAGNGTILTPGGAHSPAVMLSRFKPDHSLYWTDYYGGSNGYQAAFSVSIKPGSPQVVYIGGETETSDLYYHANGTAYYDPSNSNATPKGFLARFDADGFIQWSTYFGDQNVWVTAITHDAGGRLVITGDTYGDLPTNQGGDLPPPNASYYPYHAIRDAFITLFNAADRIIWSTFYGGSGVDHPKEIRANGSFIVVAGWTTSQDIATHSGGGSSYTEAWHGGVSDVFLAEFNMNGTIQWATYFGGSAGDEIGLHGLDIHPTNSDVYLAGHTFSTDLPFYAGSNWYDNTPVGNDGFIVHFSGADRSRLLVTYVSGQGGTTFESVRVDKAGRFVAAGGTLDQQFPYQPAAGLYSTNQPLYDEGNGWSDGVIMWLDNTHHLLWSSYFGGNAGFDGEGIKAISLADGLIYAAGVTSKNDNIFTFFPLFDPGSPAWYDDLFNSPNNIDGFVTAFCIDHFATGIDDADQRIVTSAFEDGNGWLNISGLRAGQTPVRVYNAIGQVVDAFTVSNDGKSIAAHRLPEIANGMYVVSVPGVLSTKFLHQR